MSERFPDFMEKVEEQGVRYIRIMPCEDDPTSAIGRGWKSTFLTESRGLVFASLSLSFLSFSCQRKQKKNSVLLAHLGNGSRTGVSKPSLLFFLRSELILATIERTKRLFSTQWWQRTQGGMMIGIMASLLSNSLMEVIVMRVPWRLPHSSWKRSQQRSDGKRMISF
jgi:hypothetical protein